MLLSATRAATETDELASIIYEQWAVLTLFRFLVALDWQPIDASLLERNLFDGYDVRIQRGKPWEFRRAGNSLFFYYEPELHWVKTGAGQYDDQYPHALANEQIWKVSEPALFHTWNYRTPDFALWFKLANGNHSLVIGDALFCPIGDEDAPRFEDGAPVWPSASAQARFEGKWRLQGKLSKVRDDYSANSFLLSSGGATRAARHLGFVLYPGAAGSERWVGEIEKGVVAFPLLPDIENRGNDVQGEAAALERFEQLLAAALAAATAPDPRPQGK